MQSQSEATLPNRYDPASFRTTARIVGVLYLAGMVVGIGGNILIQSILRGPDHLSTIAASSMLLTLGVVLWLSTVAGDAAHGILMFPVLRPHSERAAVGYLDTGHPGGLWELFIGVWLIVKGFSTSSQRPSEPTISSTTPVVTPPLVGSAAP
jgi:hypothetical protein